MKQYESDQRRDEEGVVYAFACEIERRYGRWFAKLSFQKQDDVDLFLCPWIDYTLDGGLATDLGYTCAAWRRKRLDKRIEKAKLAVMA